MKAFQMIREIGRGGYGRAILSECLDDHTLKVLKEVNLSDVTRIRKEALAREVRALKCLHHSNIIGYDSHHFEDGKLYIAMEYADDGDLRAHIRARKGEKFSEEIIVDWFVQMCLALKYIHNRKIVHRDIKPENIFLTKAGIVKLGDFGLAAFLPFTNALLETSVGTPYYLSPELTQGSKYNHKSDIWALGCVLFEMCTLERAFSGISVRQITAAIQSGKNPRLPRSFSRELRVLFSMLLAHDPSKRPTADQILTIPYLRYKAVALLGRTQARAELCHTVFHGVPAGEGAPEAPNCIRLLSDLRQLGRDIREGLEAPPEPENAPPQSDAISFMGRELILPRLGAEASNASRAEALRAFIEGLAGTFRLRELHRALSESDADGIRAHVRTASDRCIAQLVLRLIACEEAIAAANAGAPELE
jgi:NIMA (never in mitosis gene a)-related kinase